ncbi:Retrovirus-related Pol polyprotein from transposon TNT 1-94 [Vitis vinifera]|nr:Retrovirus-related Pol polyprotein from transposon TNT 1-94 [Vitis vinifera]
MGDATYVISIKIHRDIFRGFLGLSQETDINKVCTIPDIAFAIGMLGRYQSDLGIKHWKDAKKVMRYLQGSKDYMFICRRVDNLEVIGYSNSDYVGCIDSRKSTLRYDFMLAGGVVS